jgi:hypothetical protein
VLQWDACTTVGIDGEKPAECLPDPCAAGGVFLCYISIAMGGGSMRHTLEIGTTLEGILLAIVANWAVGTNFRVERIRGRKLVTKERETMSTVEAATTEV